MKGEVSNTIVRMYIWQWESASDLVLLSLQGYLCVFLWKDERGQIVGNIRAPRVGIREREG